MFTVPVTFATLTAGNQPASLIDQNFTAILNALNGISQGSFQAGAYPAVNADKGKFFVLGGGAFYNFTLAAPAGYDSNFQITIANPDTRFKIIAASGLANYYLPPGGIVRFYINNSGTWSASPSSQRYVLSANTTLYVDVTNGLDTNDGLASGAGNAWKTIQHAENFIKSSIDANGFSIVVQLAAGTYPENVVISSVMIGAHVYTIQGDATSAATAANYIIDGGGGAGTDAIFCTDDGQVTLNGVTVKNSGATGVHVTQGGICDIKGNTNLGVASVQVNIGQLGRVNYSGPHSLTGNATNMTQVNGGSVSWGSSITVTIGSALTYTTFLAMTNGFADTSGAAVTFSGAGVAGTTGKLYTVAMNGALVLSGTTLPGNVAGTTSTGGQVSP